MPQSLFLDSPYFLPVVIVVVIIAILYFGKFKLGKKGSEYKPEEFGVVINKDLNESINLQGKGFGLFSPGKLFLGMHEIGVIDKYYFGKGKFASFYFDDEKKDYFVEKQSKDEPYDLLFVRLKGPSLIHKLFGIKKFFVVAKVKDGDKDLITFDVEKRRIELPRDTHFKSYGNVWHNCSESAEYVNDIAIKRLSEVTMTHVQSFPDKVILLDTDQIKKERLGRIYSEIESKKWEKRKNAEDTVIE